MEWPFIGRDQILRRLTALLDEGRARGVEIVGQAGVGKSRLATELVREAAGRGRATEWIAASRATGDIPYGAFAHLISPPPAVDEGRLLAIYQAELAGRSNDRGPLVLAVDDADLLDSRSGALLRGVVSRRDAFVVLTRLLDGASSAELTGLWKDDLIERIEVRPLLEQDTVQLLEAGLGGPVESATRAMFWRRSGGNPLWLRELVLGALETGTLVRGAAGWRALDGFAPSGRLAELVAARLGRLDAAERRLVEVLAIGGDVDLRVLEALEDPALVERLEDRRLLDVRRSGNRYQARLAHPIYADVIAASLPRTRVRRLTRWLADRLEERGARRQGDLLRLALWRLESGGVASAELLETAAGQALAVFDAALAERFARAGLAKRRAAVSARLLLGRALASQGRVRDADEVLAEAARSATTDAEIAGVAIARADALFFGAGRHGEASTILSEASDRVNDEDWRDEIHSLLVLFRAQAGDLLGVAQVGRRMVERPNARPRAVAHALMYSSIANVLLGRFAEAERQVDVGIELALAARDELPLAHEMLGINRLLAHAYSGRLASAVALGEAGYRAALESGAAELLGLWGMNLAECRWLAGDVEGSLRAELEAHASAGDRDPFAVRGIVAARASMLCAWLGRHDDALRIHQEIVDEGLVRDVRSRVAFDRATVWTTWARDGAKAAARVAAAAGDHAADDHHIAWAAWTLHDAVRLGHPKLVRDRLVKLASTIEGALIPTTARHAVALADSDAAELDRVANAFEAVGCALFAAEAAAHARDAHLRRGEPSLARLAGARAALLAASCPGVVTPPLADAARVPLTPRELEVAVLAASGLRSREIGERLGIMVRTVDNHLGAVYEKLGAEGRRDLPEVFGVRSLG